MTAAMLLLISSGAKAQSFLNNLVSSDVVSTVVSTVTGGTTLSTSSIAGTWTYSGPAVELSSSSTLSSIAGSLATSTIEDKISTYYSAVGITSGSFSFTFGSDNSFSCTLKSKNLSGTYSLDSANDQITLTFSAASTVNLGSMTANISLSGSSLSLLFDADKLLELVSAVASVSDNSSLQTVNSLLENYDGVMIGFELSK